MVLKLKRKEKTSLTVNMPLKRSYGRKKGFLIKKMMIVKLKSTWKDLKRKKCRKES